MGNEPVLPNTVPAAAEIACPKCGFVQEERLDCLKCGVVFSKYYALFHSAEPGGESGADGELPPEPADPDVRTSLSDLQSQIRALHGRLAEVNFEKAERNQIRADLKALQRQLEENVKRLENRLDRCDDRLEHPPVPLQSEEALSDIPVLYDRIGQVEERLVDSDLGCRRIEELAEKQDDAARKLSELETQLAAIRREAEALRAALDAVRAAKKAEDPQTGLEEDVHVIRRNLVVFRRLLAKPSGES